jgi:translation initiation factor 2B subunit (eIF-2B alpha/beta/delta family)
VISSAEFFEEISSDRLHGASQVYSKFLSLLATYLQHFDDFSERFVNGLPGAIIKVRGDMAPFYYAALRLSELVSESSKSGAVTQKRLLDLVKGLQEEQGAAIEKIVETVKPMISGAGSVMLHSYSGTVTSVIREALPKSSRIFLSEAYPDREGEKLGEELAPLGYTVTLFADDARYHYLKRVDLVLLGSDWVAEDSFMNKIGTTCLTLAAVNESKPVIVVADQSKLVPSKFRREFSANRVRLSKNLYREVCLFEEVDNQFVDKFVTDGGVFTSAEISNFVTIRARHINFPLE